MSRPSSRLSAGSGRDGGAGRSHQLQHARSTSALSASTSMAPFTPGPASSKTASSRLGGLSDKEVHRISQTIASVRRGSRSSLDDHDNNEYAANGAQARQAAARSTGSTGHHAVPLHDRKGKAKASVAPNASFIAEASFVDAPLNSRVNPAKPASPSRQPARANGTRLPAELAKQRLTSKRLRQIISGGEDEEEDNEQDLRLYAEHIEESDEQNGSGPLDDLSQADLSIQEALLVEDLLSVLTCGAGQFISIDPDYGAEDEEDQLKGARYVVDERIDPSLQDLVYRILPASTYYTGITAFLQTYQHLSYGLTSHALCSAIRTMLQEYLVMVAQLEEKFESSPSFSLQRFYFFIQPLLHKLFLIYNLTRDIAHSPADADASTENEAAESDEDDDRFGGGAALREAMKGMSTSNDKKADGWQAGGQVKGGEILALIDERLQRTSGDPVADQIYSTLLLRASQPYAQNLLKWISTGQLADPYDEFMIRESKSVDRVTLDQDYVDEYWERKYTLKDAGLSGSASSAGPAANGADEQEGPDALGLATSNSELGAEPPIYEKRDSKRTRGLGGGAVVPSFLERWKTKILLAGKYLNVIRECGAAELQEILQTQAAETGGTEPGQVALDSEPFTARVDSAYLAANAALLRVLIQQQSLFPRLKSLKHHFFLDQGDSFTHFLDLAHTELAKKARHVSLSKLQSLLDLAIRNPSSASGADPYNEDVKVAMSGSTLTDWLMKVVNVSGAIGTEDPAEAALPESASKEEKKSSLTGIEALSLDYTVTFPLSLVISRKAILRYQLIFRHLLSLKHLEQSLTVAWSEHSKNPAWRKRSQHIELEKWKNRVFNLRARMLAFVQQMFAFAVSEVLEGNWRILMNKLESVSTVDGLLRHHIDFLDTCMKECMLTNPALLKTQSKLMMTISLFAAHKNRFATAAARIARSAEEALERGEDWRSVSLASEEDSLQRFEIHFYKHQKAMADRVQFHAFSDTNALLALLVRLANTVPQEEGPIA